MGALPKDRYKPLAELLFFFSSFLNSSFETEAKLVFLKTQHNGVALNYPKFTCWIWSLVSATYFLCGI